MALTNFSLPFGGGLPTPHWATISPLQQHATAVNNLLYGPVNHQQDTNNEDDGYYKNDPYAPPQQLSTAQQRYQTRNNNYLPPPPQQPAVRTQYVQQQLQSTRTYGENSYANVPPSQRNVQIQQQTPPPQQQAPPSQQYFNSYNQRRIVYTTPAPVTEPAVTPQSPVVRGRGGSVEGTAGDAGGAPGVDSQAAAYPQQATSFTRVQAGTGSRTQVHAVLDYDDDGGEEDEYYDDDDGTDTRKPPMPTVTPIQGPIFIKNGSVPVVPLLSYPTLNNGSFVQIPIWWTALSVALGLEIRGEIIRGTPCVKRFNQLFCPTAGNSYPIERIEEFIDENKALMRRMYGDFQMNSEYGPPPPPPGQQKKRKRQVDMDNDPMDDIPLPGVPDYIGPPAAGEQSTPVPQTTPKGDSIFAKWRSKRQSSRGNNNNNNNNNQAIPRQSNGSNGPTRPSVGPNPSSEPNTGRIDACESKIEIVTPYWASNSAGKIRAIVNTQHFEQAIHQEVCTKMQTNRCGGDCGCEQKYKWHRLLAYDPDNDCRGIFMDWFLFPSCCVCRCSP